MEYPVNVVLIIVVSLTGYINFSYCEMETSIDHFNIETFLGSKLVHISRNYNCHCDIAVVSKSAINFSSKVPSIILSGNFTEKTLPSVCNALVILPPPGKRIAEFLAEVKSFIYVNYSSIQTILLLGRDSIFDFVFWMKGIQKQFLFIDKLEKNVSEYHFGVGQSCEQDLRCMLHRQKIKIGYSSVKPYFVVDGSVRDENGNIPTLEMTPVNIGSMRNYFYGIETELVKILVETYGIFFTLIPSSFGMELTNGTWTGKFAFLVDRKVHMLAGCLPGNYRRNLIGEYSSQIFMIRFTLTSRKPGLLSSYQAPLRPFPFTAWFILLLSVAIVGPLTWWITKKHYNFMGRDFIATASQISGQAALTLVVEPWKNPPNGPATFILTGWFLACLILQCIYSSNLIASFSIVEYQQPVNTFEDARKLSKMVLIKDGSTPSLFLNEQSPDANFKVVATIEEMGVHALEDDHLVGTHDHLIFRYKILTAGRKMADFHISKRPFLNIFAGWIYSKDFKFKDAINMAILRVADSGLFQKWEENQFINGSNEDRILAGRSEREHYAFRILGMEHLKAVFDFWIAGAIMSTITLFLECALHVALNRRKVIPVGRQQLYPYIN